jgi:hypothetical protein
MHHHATSRTVPYAQKSSTRKRKAGPAYETLPAVDERLVMPESRAEILDGKVYFVPAADEAHGTLHARLAAILRAHVAVGYAGAVNLLTRTSMTDDFGSFACVYPSEGDPETEGRKLEEIAFQIAPKSSLSMPTRKARKLSRRGVRRIFSIVLKEQRVLEWSCEAGAFQPLPNNFQIDDRCFVRPLPIVALFDGDEADGAIIGALHARKDPTLMAMLDEAHKEGFKIGQLRVRRQTLFQILDGNGHPIEEQIRAKIEACTDVATLDQWILNASIAQPFERPKSFDLLGPS